MPIAAAPGEKRWNGYNADVANASARSTAVTSRGQLPLIVIVLLLAAFIALGQANPFTSSLGTDSGMFAYVGSQVLRGNTPYVAAWDHKPPAVFFINAAGLWLGHGTRWGIWGMELIFLTGAALAGFMALRKIFGLGPAMFSAVIWLSGLTFVLEGGNFTEEYALLFSFLSLWLFSKLLERGDDPWLQAAIGMAFGCSFLTRPNNAGVPFAIICTQVLLDFLHGRPRNAFKVLFITGIGLIIPLSGTALYFAARVAFGPLLDGSFGYNLSDTGNAGFIGSLLAGIRDLGFAAGVAIVGMSVAVVELLKQIRSRRIDPLLLWLCLDFIVEVALSGLSGRNYPHYFISWLPWIAVASALVAHRLFPGFRAWSEGHAIPFLAASALGIVVVSTGTLADYGRTFITIARDRSQVQQADQVAEYVNEHSSPGDTVLVWGGEAGINFLASRDAPSPYFLYGTLASSPITDHLSAEFIQQVKLHPPVLILDGQAGDAGGTFAPLSTPNPVEWSARNHVFAAPYLQEFFDFVHENYTLKTTVARVPIYRLKP